MNTAIIPMRRYLAQEVLFAPMPGRLELQQLQIDGGETRQMTINVWRNHAIEPILTLIKPYAEFGKIRTVFNLSAYDDALLFEGHRQADVEVIWLDSDRYFENMSFDEWVNWLCCRIMALRAISLAPILLVTWLEAEERRVSVEAMLASHVDCHFADIGALGIEAGISVIDLRSAVISGTRLNSRIHPLVARKLACHWLPASALPPVKAVVVDLDQTLYEGVLGEDGIAGIRLTPAHRELQEALVALKKRGIYLAVISRNEGKDVENLFSCRRDFPLRWNDFSIKEISWQEKTVALVRVAEFLRVALDSVLYVDDNPGELAAISQLVPDAHTLHASTGALLTRLSIEYYPGLWRWRTDADDERRIADLAANELRQQVQRAVMDNSEYFLSLDVNVVFCINPKEDLARLADLCGKTNQFNLSLRRYTQAELSQRIGGQGACVVGVRLRDRLGDSGTIAVIVASRLDDRLLIEELCISCRALGRRLEDTIIREAIRSMPITEGCREIVFCITHGPRNGPALEWLRRAARLSHIPSSGEYVISSLDILGWSPPEGITYRVE